MGIPDKAEFGSYPGTLSRIQPKPVVSPTRGNERNEPQRFIYYCEERPPAGRWNLHSFRMVMLYQHSESSPDVVSSWLVPRLLIVVSHSISSHGPQRILLQA